MAGWNGGSDSSLDCRGLGDILGNPRTREQAPAIAIEAKAVKDVRFMLCLTAGLFGGCKCLL
jgi:hypothetical protein